MTRKVEKVPRRTQTGGYSRGDETRMRIIETALDMFGQSGVSELIYLVGHYCFVSITLNGFDIPVPDGG